MSIRLALFILSFMHCEHSFANHKVMRWLQSPRVTNWGKWGPREFCPTNTWVAGMTLKVEPAQGPFSDDTALNAIQLQCRTIDGKYYGHISSDTGSYGSYRGVKYCPNGFATGFQIRTEPPQGTGDDTGVINFKLKCTNFDGTTSLILSDEIELLPWGTWSEEQNCPAKTAICGIVTQVEPCQGGGNLDDTALNNVDLACCNIPDPALESCQLHKKWEAVTVCQIGRKKCEMNFITGIFMDEKQSNLSIFSKDLTFVKKELELKARENRSKKINDTSITEIINETEIAEKTWSIQLNCEGVIQQLVLICDCYKVYTKKYRCIPYEKGFQGKHIKGLFFQSMTSSKKILWSYDCDFSGGNITNTISRSEECGDICFGTDGCTHFTWSTHHGGTCWIKGSGVTLLPVEKYDENLICGWIERE